MTSGCLKIVSWSKPVAALTMLLPVISLVGAYVPDGKVPVSLENHMPQSWDLSTLKNRIWVEASAEGDGLSEANALGTIQEAVNKAKPGTVILVKAGDYEEHISLPPDAPDGTDESPIFLVSADGIGAAKVHSKGKVSTFSSWKNANWGVVGFQFDCSNGKYGPDESPVKLGGQFDGDGNPLNYNWFVAGNLITGTGRDGTKFFGGCNIYWIGNTYDGMWWEELCDHVGVGVLDSNGQDNQFGFNSLKGNSTNTGVTVKNGTNNYLIFNNDFGYSNEKGHGAGILLGGRVGEAFANPPAIPSEAQNHDFYPRTAKYVSVLYNKFLGKFGKDVVFYGATHCTVSHNFMANAERRGLEISDQTGKVDPNTVVEPAYNTITDNKIRAIEENAFVELNGPENMLSDGEGTNTISGNSSEVMFDYPIGAEHIEPLITSLIQQMRNGN